MSEQLVRCIGYYRVLGVHLGSTAMAPLLLGHRTLDKLLHLSAPAFPCLFTGCREDCVKWYGM